MEFGGEKGWELKVVLRVPDGNVPPSTDSPV